MPAVVGMQGWRDIFRLAAEYSPEDYLLRYNDQLPRSGLVNLPGCGWPHPPWLANIAIFRCDSNAECTLMSMIQNKKAGARYVTVDAGQQNRRIDNFILGELGRIPRSRIYQMLRRGEIRVNGGRIRQDYRVQPGDKIRIPPVHFKAVESPGRPGNHLLDLIRQSLIFENETMLVINKPAGISVHGGSGQLFGVIEILRCLRPGDTDLQLVHRLDRDTSGCLMISKNSQCLRWLHECLRRGMIEKRYLALLKGKLPAGPWEIAEPVRKNITKSGERMATVSESGKRAVSVITRSKLYRGTTLVTVRIATGRTHQIRVHAAHILHPIAGDTKYGDRSFNQQLKKIGLRRLFLHAGSLVIPAWPGQQPRLELECGLPDELAEVLENMRI